MRFRPDKPCESYYARLSSMDSHLVSWLVNSLTFCVPLRSLAKATSRWRGGPTSRDVNTGQRPQRHALREPLSTLIAALRCFDLEPPDLQHRALLSERSVAQSSVELTRQDTWLVVFTCAGFVTDALTDRMLVGCIACHCGLSDCVCVAGDQGGAISNPEQL